MTAGLLAEITRRDQRTGEEFVESSHAGHVVVLEGRGEQVGAVGDPDHQTFARSAVKPFQAAASLEAAEDLAAALTTPEIAVGWASHRAEPRHLEAVELLLSRSGTEPDALTTPPDVGPADPVAEPARIRHNCSGKHALFALAGHTLGVPRDRLLDPGGPLQERVLALLDEVVGPVSAVGVDGCGAPAVRVPLSGLAAGFRRLWLDPRFAAVREAGLAEPGLVSGEGRLASALLAAGVVAKAGAEGVFGASWATGRGVWSAAVKCADGDGRGASAALHGLLASARVIPGDIWEPPPPLGGGRPAGTVRASPAIIELGQAVAARGGADRTDAVR